ncbi:YheC/YheD family endospore coat-associated protein [Natronincola ferrireducens]|nr:YheC/YheD family protein [Natronincola ferrireducens]
MMYIQYIESNKNDRIFLSKQSLESKEIIYKNIVLHLGCWKKEVTVEYIENFPSDTIGLSEKLTKNFILPTDLAYKVRFEGRNIYIGPIIGLLIVSKHRILTLEFLDKYKPYLTYYNDINGLVFIASSEGINRENQTMKGYYYKPNGNVNWVEGTFPYPDSLYRRIGISGAKYDDLIKHMGDKIFNTYFFNKWELWECLYPYKQTRQHLPYTEVLTDVGVLDKVLSSYGTVYLKRISGQKSRGIYKVHKSEKGYHFIDRGKKEKILCNLEEVNKFIKKIKKQNGSYLIQQAIKIKNFENRSFDLRVVLQKDESKGWGLTSMIARFGGSGGVASNIGLDGFAMLGKDAIKKVFDMNEKEVFLKQQEIINICKTACETLDQSIGHYGDLGIDVVIDENQKIWILEINKLHYHPYPIYALKDRQMYYDIASKPLKYANALAGFN